MKEKKSITDDCKPRNNDFVKEKIDELSGSLDEMLAVSPRMRKTSYQQALLKIKQFSNLAKECNYIIEPEN
ncbi:MAG: hypothetical protein ACFFBX_07070 [Promethearchaeota archaeon]